MKNTIHVLNEFDPTLFSEKKVPMVSIYVTTHPHNADKQQDRLAFKNLINEAEKYLTQHFSTREHAGILDNLNAIEQDVDRDIWRHTKEGLAVLADDQGAYIYHLDYPVENEVFVADSFHIKPLIRNFQYGAHYFVLALSAAEFSLYSGDFDTLEKVELPDGIESEFTKAFPDFDSGSASGGMSYGGSDPNFYGQGSKKDMALKDAEKFFRYVDGAVNDLIGGKTSCPLILVALSQNQALFREITGIATLLEEGIEKPFESMPFEEVRERSTRIITDIQKSYIAELLDLYGQAHANGRASTDLRTIGFALIERKVAALFVDKDTVLRGHFDRMTGAIDLMEKATVGFDDLTDDFAQITYLQNGEVYIVESENMPEDAAVAALFRY